MEKNIRVNIGGFVFNLSQTAFSHLEAYFNQIKQAFDEEEAEEISKDIEYRIAELLREKGMSGDTVVDENDILLILNQIGTPVETEEEEFKSETSPESSPKKPLFRHPDDRYLGGVCGGLGVWLNLNPNVVRAVFIILALFKGIGILIYGILWVITPEAKSRVDLLKMQGKTPTLNNLSEAISSEFKYLKQSFGRIKNSEGFKQLPEHINNLLIGITKIFLGLFRILLFGVGLISLVVSSAVLFVFVASLFFPFSVYSPWAWLNSAFDPIQLIFWQQSMVVKTGAVLVIGIPLLFILIGSLRILFNLPYRQKKWIRLSGLLMWLTGFFMLGSVALNMKKMLREDARKEVITDLEDMKNDTLYVRFKKQDLQPLRIGDANMEIDYATWDINKDKAQLIGKVPFYIRTTTEDSVFKIKWIKYAAGPSEKEAEKEIENISYFSTFKNDTLILNEYFTLKDSAKYWRHQRVKVYIYVPENKAIEFNGNIRKKKIRGIDRYVQKNLPKRWINKDNELIYWKDLARKRQEIENVSDHQTDTLPKPELPDEIEEMKKELEDL